MKIVILIALILNFIAYAYIFISWKMHCKTIGKNNLAVSLKERLRACFMCVTLPCLLGILIRKD